MAHIRIFEEILSPPPPPPSPPSEGSSDQLSLAVVFGVLGAFTAEVIGVVYVGYYKQIRAGTEPILTFWPLMRVLLTLVDFASDFIFTLDLYAAGNVLTVPAAAFVIIPVLANATVLSKLFIRESEAHGHHLDLAKIKNEYDTYFPILLVSITNTEILEALPWKNLAHNEELPFKLPERWWIVWTNTLSEDVPQLLIEFAVIGMSDTISPYTVASLSFTIIQLLVTIFRKFLGQLLDQGISNDQPPEIATPAGHS